MITTRNLKREACNGDGLHDRHGSSFEGRPTRLTVAIVAFALMTAGCTVGPVRTMGDGQTRNASAAFSRDGKFLCAGGDDGIVRVWDVKRAREIARRSGFDASVLSPENSGVAFAPDGSVVAHGTASGALALWRWRTNSAEELPGHPIAPAAIAFSPDGREIVSASGGYPFRDGRYQPLKVIVWDVRTGRRVGGFDHVGGGWTSVAMSPDGAAIAISGMALVVRDCRSGREIFSPQPSVATMAVSFSADGRRLYGSMMGGANLNEDRVWSLPDGRLIASGDLADMHALDGPSTAFFSVDGRRLVSLSRGREYNLFSLVMPPSRVRMTDLRTSRSRFGQSMRARDGWERDVSVLAPSPDRRTFVDRRMRLWKVPK